MAADSLSANLSFEAVCFEPFSNRGCQFVCIMEIVPLWPCPQV